MAELSLWQCRLHIPFIFRLKSRLVAPKLAELLSRTTEVSACSTPPFLSLLA